MPQAKPEKAKGKGKPKADVSPNSVRTSPKKSKRNPRPPRAVRLSQSDRRLAPPPRSDRIGVSVTVNLPRIKRSPKPTESQPRLIRLIIRCWNRLILIVRRVPLPVKFRRPLAVALVGLIIIGGVALHRHNVGGSKTTVDPSTATAQIAATAKPRSQPNFKPLIPSSNETIQNSYDGTRNVISYETSFSGARLTVSQQPLPQAFHDDPNTLPGAAASIHAKQRLETAKGPIYIATNDQGDQMAIYAGPEVLVFIHSDRKLDSPSWIAFVQLLKQKT